MSYNKIQMFLDELAKSAPQDQSAYLKHCNEVWAKVSDQTDFLVFPALLARAIQAAQFLDLNNSARDSLLETLDEIKADFGIQQLLGPAAQIWQSRFIAYPLLARSIRQATYGNKLSDVQNTELGEIEEDVRKLKATSDNAELLEPEARDAVREITELLNSAINAIRVNGLADFTLDRPFLFGNLSLIFQREKVDFGEVREDIIQIVKRIWAFGNIANTSADMYGKLISMVG
jgi:hypothetical protein